MISILIIPPLIYALFIMSINALSEPKRAYKGNLMAIMAMILSFILSFYYVPYEHRAAVTLSLILGAFAGLIIAHRIKIPDLPQLIALLNGSGGLAAGLIGITEASGPNHYMLLVILIIAVGFLTFSGSIAAFIKLSNSKIFIDKKSSRTSAVILLIMSIIGAFYAYSGNIEYILGFAILVSLWGLFFILPIGGADMSIIISILNSFSGWSTVLVGFSLNNTLLIIVGTLIGSSGTILSHIMTKAMNRNLLKVIFYSLDETKKEDSDTEKNIHLGSIADASFLMENAHKIIIIPGFGMAAANAQNEVVNMAKILRNKYNVTVKYAIHPVAGRMPGHMNVLLAEANADPDFIFELKQINQEFATTDVVYAIGANDIINPLAKKDIKSPIYQMPVLDAELAKKVIIVKRSLGHGYADIDNPLFYRDNTLMLLGDAKTITKQIVTALEEDRP